MCCVALQVGVDRRLGSEEGQGTAADGYICLTHRDVKWAEERRGHKFRAGKNATLAGVERCRLRAHEPKRVRR